MNLSTARTAGISRYASLQSFHLDEAYDTPPRPQGKNLAAGTEADMVAAETTVAGQNPDADQLRFIHTEEEEEEEEEDIEKHEEKCDGEDEEDLGGECECEAVAVAVVYTTTLRPPKPSSRRLSYHRAT